STFGCPLYTKWADEYHKQHPNVQINYQGIGSGGGIRQISEKTVDFGATDGPMNDQQLAKAQGKLVHIPTVLGGVVAIVNVRGVKSIRFTGPLLAGIYLGKITMWNDPAIAKANPGVALPDEPITVVHRADGSGTTYCWADYLCKVSPEWKKQVGVATSLDWPVGLGGKGSDGVSGLVKQNEGSIGYVELIYALQNKIDFAAVKNSAGRYVKASLSSVTAAAAAAKMPKDYRVSITNAPGRGAYPISTYTWLLVYQKNQTPQGRALKVFLKWMLRAGQKIAPSLAYAPLPARVRAMVARTVAGLR
ncbi:MAG: phosphate ABC transporter substrate-binding protein PstS, partial [Elusimicrobia bacterium]|nr:phosphate ABC transporter substrate-binding protein PstS [Elusimicrobiota bacterium]